MTCWFVHSVRLGLYQCTCHDSRQCHKGKNSLVCQLSPRCFQYHDRHVQEMRP